MRAVTEGRRCTWEYPQCPRRKLAPTRQSRTVVDVKCRDHSPKRLLRGASVAARTIHDDLNLCPSLRGARNSVARELRHHEHSTNRDNTFVVSYLERRGRRLANIQSYARRRSLF